MIITLQNVWDGDFSIYMIIIKITNFMLLTDSSNFLSGDYGIIVTS